MGLLTAREIKAASKKKKLVKVVIDENGNHVMVGVMSTSDKIKATAIAGKVKPKGGKKELTLADSPELSKSF